MGSTIVFSDMESDDHCDWVLALVLGLAFLAHEIVEVAVSDRFTYTPLVTEDLHVALIGTTRINTNNT